MRRAPLDALPHELPGESDTAAFPGGRVVLLQLPGFEETLATPEVLDAGTSISALAQNPRSSNLRPWQMACIVALSSPATLSAAVGDAAALAHPGWLGVETAARAARHDVTFSSCGCLACDSPMCIF